MNPNPAWPPAPDGGATADAATLAQDASYLRMLPIFYYVLAGFVALFASIFVIHIIIGILALVHPSTVSPSGGDKAFGYVFIATGTTIVLVGWGFAGLIAYAGRCISQRKHYVYIFVMAAVSALGFPFGTALGVFTIIVLMRPSVKALFEHAAH